MSLLMPDTGLLFWMLLSFGVVFFVLAKYGFPVITNMVNERKQYIDKSLEAAHEANSKLNHIKEEGESILAQAREEHAKILKEATEIRNRIVEEAREKARAEGERLVNETRVQLQKEKESVIREMRKQTAELSVEVAEKILRSNLDNERKQMDMIERLLDEVNISKS